MTGFHELYESYSRDVYRFALYLSGDPALADDVTSETFIRVWSSPEPIRMATVKAYLLSIPEVDRAALLMRADEGLAYEEIAVALGLPVATVKVKVHRARLRLAQIRNEGVSAQSRALEGACQPDADIRITGVRDLALVAGCRVDAEV